MRRSARYLDEVLDGPKLFPGDARSRAVVEQWISVESELHAHAMKIIYQLMLGLMRGQTPDLTIVEMARASLGHTLSIMEARLERSEYLVGWSSPSPTSCTSRTSSSSSRASRRPHHGGHPLVGAWWSRCSARPSWRRAIGQG